MPFAGYELDDIRRAVTSGRRPDPPGLACDCPPRVKTLAARCVAQVRPPSFTRGECVAEVRPPLSRVGGAR